MKKFILLISIIFVDNTVCMDNNLETALQQIKQKYNTHDKIKVTAEKLSEKIQQSKQQDDARQKDTLNIKAYVQYLKLQHLIQCNCQQTGEDDQLKLLDMEIAKYFGKTKDIIMLKAYQEYLLPLTVKQQANIQLLQNKLNQKEQQIQALQNQLNQQNNNTDNQQDENTDNQQDKDNKPQDNNNQDPKQNSNVGRVTINTIHKTRENNNTNNNSESAKIFKIEKNSQTQIEIDYANVAEHLNTIDAKPKIIVNSSNKSPDIMPPSTNQAEANPVVS